jgi:hypothetical protein
VTFYRVTLLDREGIVADTRTSDSLAGTAKLMLDLAGCIGEPWTKPLLDADGELTVSVKGAADRELSEDEKAGLTALLEEFGAFQLEHDDSGGRWGIGGEGERS